MGTPDLYDAATQLEEAEREWILKAHAERKYESPLVVRGVRLCIECQEAIDKKRIQAAPHCVRCFSCQHDHDSLTQRGLR